MADLLFNSLFDFPFYALLATSFVISFRMLNFPDLAIDSSYALGMAGLVAMIQFGSPRAPLTLSLLLALLGGFMVGSITASLHGFRWFRLSKLLAGLIVSFAMFSVNFRLNLGTTTNGLYGREHEFNHVRDRLASGSPQTYRVVIFLICVCILALVISVTWLLLRRGLASHLRVAGHRPGLLVEAGSSPLAFMILGLGTANAIAAFAGCLRAAVDNYADINTFGTFIYALASLLLGEKVLGMSEWGRRHRHKLGLQLLAPVVGGLLMSLLVQGSIWILSSVVNVYLSCDIRLIIALVLLLTGANSRLGDSNGGSFDGR